MFGQEHKGHEFEHLSSVYDTNVEMIRSEAGNLRKRLNELSLLLHTVDANIDKVKKCKEERCNELV